MSAFYSVNDPMKAITMAANKALQAIGTKVPQPDR